MVVNENGEFSKVFEIETTTSFDGTDNPEWGEELEGINKYEMGNDSKWVSKCIEKSQKEEKLEGMPQFLRYQFSERTFLQKLLRLVYMFFRSSYVIVWYYFMPFLAVVFQFVILSGSQSNQ